MKILRLMCLTLLLLLVSCGVLAQTPPDKAIELAVSQQLRKTQQSLAQDLGILATTTESGGLTSNFKIEKITVQSRTKITESEQLARPEIDEIYQVRGMFTVKLQAPGYGESVSDGPFEVFLGTNSVANELETDERQTAQPETWFLIQP